MEVKQNTEMEDNNLTNSRLRSIEEKNRIMKDQIFLLNKNLIEIKESTSSKVLEMKKEIERLNEELKNISQFLEMISSEFQKFAKKEDIEILYRHAKMFNPIEFVTKKELKELSEEKIKKESFVK